MENFSEIFMQFEQLIANETKLASNASLGSSLSPSLLSAIHSLEPMLGFSIYYISHTDQPTLTLKGRILLQVLSSKNE